MGVESAEARDIALIVESSNAYARGLLLGIKRFAEFRPGWSFYLGEHSRSETDLSWLEHWRGHGIIARIENQEIADGVRGMNVPTVDMSAAGLAPEFPAVETDDWIIGRWAVEHFSERGIRSFAYCGDSRFAWSEKRADSFRHHLAVQGRTPQVLSIHKGETLADSRIRMAEWVSRLPKPVGVLACYDIAGQELIEACKLAHVSVPDDLAVLGVDNDELMCNFTTPPLSSIQPDALGTGFLAASLLDGMMAGSATEPGLRLLPPLRIVTRQSSDIRAVSDPLVGLALRHIHERAEENISVSEVTRHVRLSRRALDYRFVRAIGHTVHEEIIRVRMERLSDLLIRTDWTLPQLSARLGFSHSEYMGVAFKKYTGMSPGEFRRANSGSPLIDEQASR